jgi:sugar phosphate permease
MGIAAGSSLLTPVIAFIVLNYGWRLAATISGVLVLALGVPLTSMLRNSPEDVGQTPDGDIGVNKLRSTRSSTTDFKVREAVRTRAYWLLAIGIALRISAINGVMVHIVPLMVWKGFGEGAGGVVIATGSMAAIGTRFVMGWMGDRWSKRKIVCVSMLVGMNSLILIWYLPGNLALIATFVVTLSVTDGAAGLTWAMLGDYFGASYYATLRGVMNTMTSLGTLSSPVIAGIIFDATQSYSWALLLFAGVYGLAFTVFFSVRGPEKYIVSDREAV